MQKKLPSKWVDSGPYGQPCKCMGSNGVRLQNTIMAWYCRGQILQCTVADPGFPIGEGANLIGGANSQHAYILKNLYVKTKELGLLGIISTGPKQWR